MNDNNVNTSSDTDVKEEKTKEDIVVFPRLVAYHGLFSLDRDWNFNTLLTKGQAILLSFGYVRSYLSTAQINMNPEAIATILSQFIPLDDFYFCVKASHRCKTNLSPLFIQYDYNQYMSSNDAKSNTILNGKKKFSVQFKYMENSCEIQPSAFEFQFGVIGIKYSSDSSLISSYFDTINQQKIEFKQSEYLHGNKKNISGKAKSMRKKNTNELSTLLLSNTDLIEKYLSKNENFENTSLKIEYLKIQRLRDGYMNVERGNSFGRYISNAAQSLLTKEGFKVNDSIRITINYQNDIGTFHFIPHSNDKENPRNPILLGYEIILLKNYIYFPVFAAFGCQCQDKNIRIQGKIL